MASIKSHESDIFSIHSARSLKHELIQIRLAQRQAIVGPTGRASIKKEYLCHDKIATRVSLSSNIFRASVYGAHTVDTHDYDYIRNLAVEKVQAEVMKQLYVIRQSVCPKEDLIKDLIPDIKPFGWSYDSFLERRKQPNTLWVDLLKIEYDPKCLQLVKLKWDLEELTGCFDTLFQTITTSDRSTYKHVMDQVIDAREFCSTMEALEMENRRHHHELNIAVNKLFKAKFHKPDERQLKYKKELSEKLMDADALFPIETRYRVDYHESRIGQSVMKIELVATNIQEQINHYREQTHRENFCHDCVMDMYYTLHTQYREQIAKFSARIDTDFDLKDAELIAKRSRLTRLREQRIFMVSEIQRFHDEIEIRKLKDERKERQEQEMLEQAMASLNKKKTNKPNKKKKK